MCVWCGSLCFQTEDAPAPPPAEEAQEEEIDIDLNDPEVEKAATKIQASFKGHKARKEVKALKVGSPGWCLGCLLLCL